jgi:hypothetical protein
MKGKKAVYNELSKVIFAIIVSTIQTNMRTRIQTTNIWQTENRRHAEIRG